MAAPYAAELFFYFQNVKVAGKYVCLCIPVSIGSSPTNAYFSTLTSDIRNDRPTLSSLLTKTSSFISYEGISLQNRSANDPTPRSMCETGDNVLTYYVSLTPAYISDYDYSRISAIKGNNPGPAKPPTDSLPPRILKLCTIVNGITLGSAAPKKTAGSGGIATNAMKCVRIDTETDIIDNKVYIDSKNKPGTLLSKELENAQLGVNHANGIKIKTKKSPIQPGDIERAIGIILGIAVGLVIASTLAVIIYKYIYKGYMQGQKLYSGPSLTSLALTPPPLPGFFSKT
jgi:hypothetical protein